MIVYKTWVSPNRNSKQGYLWHGWYLLGFIPLYLKRVGVET